jgi:anti-anti-sigma factor
MDINHEKMDDVTIIKIDKERLDSMLAPLLKSDLLVLVNEGVKKILIDLSDVTYADSSGLGALLFGLRQLKGTEGQLKLFAANDRVMSLVRIARLDDYLHNYDDRDQAIRSFAQN